MAYEAKNALEAEGIAAVVTDAETVGMTWELSNAIGGAKVQVMERDAERAAEILEGHFGPDEEIDQEALAAEALASSPEEDEEHPEEPVAEPVPTPEHAASEETNYREECARRLFFTAWFGIMCGPVVFYALYLFLNAAFGNGPISTRGRFNTFVGGLVTAVGLALWFWWVPFWMGNMVAE